MTQTDQEWVEKGRGHKVGSGVSSDIAPLTPEQAERWWQKAERTFGKSREDIISDFRNAGRQRSGNMTTRVEEQRVDIERLMRDYASELSESDHNFFVNFDRNEDALGFRESVLTLGTWATWPYSHDAGYTVRIRKVT